MIYLDNNATTPVDPAAVEAMLPFLREHFANASSGYAAAKPVRRAFDLARGQTAALLGCGEEEVIFTGGGSESDNAAIHSALHLLPNRRHIVTCSSEHDAVLRPCATLKKQGCEITRLAPRLDGSLDMESLAAAIRPGQTALVTLMWANNETGVTFPVQQAAALAENAGAFFHTDAVAAGGKVPIKLAGGAIHYLSLSGHKFHAPKGVGVLYVNKRVAFQPWLLGGGQENNRRAGTENIAGIVAVGAAAEAARGHLEGGHDKTAALRDFFESELQRRLYGVHINTGSAPRVPNTSSLRIEGTEAAAMMILLDRDGICVSAGSACHTGSNHISHVLAAMGLGRTEAVQSLRVSLSRFTTKAEIETALVSFVRAAEKVRSLLPPG